MRLASSFLWLLITISTFFFEDLNRYKHEQKNFEIILACVSQRLSRTVRLEKVVLQCAQEKLECLLNIKILW